MKAGKVKRGDWAMLTDYDPEPIMVKVGNPGKVYNKNLGREVLLGLRFVTIPGRGQEWVREEDLSPISRGIS
jgi:hypothetical protein